VNRRNGGPGAYLRDLLVVCRVLPTVGPGR
jgi:hypothetical protein